jgi:hypothetical protein
MSVPLDRLYNFLNDLCDQDTVIYRWFPHGSRKVENCKPLTRQIIDADFATKIKSTVLICHDQEPLRFDDFKPAPQALAVNQVPCSVFRAANIVPYFSLYDQYLLCHSEQHSAELDKFVADGAIPVYYWSHGMIARDWFRFAEHDPSLQRRSVAKPFLIYNRAWSGTREYRLKFAELLVDRGVADQCIMGFNPQDQQQDYRQHAFSNSDFAIHRRDLEQHFFLNQTEPTASADYVSQDYQNSEIEVVLETLYDDQRWHLTEKSLRPIACGQPFMLMSTPGSLKYLRSYGFETFSDYIDESYDLETDPVARMHRIVDSMQEFVQQQDQHRIQGMREIAKRNRQRFFSAEFTQQIVDEFKNNFGAARELLQQSLRGTYFFHYISKSPNLLNTTLIQFESEQQYQDLLQWFESNSKN